MRTDVIITGAQRDARVEASARADGYTTMAL